MLTEQSAHRKDLTTDLAEMQHRHFATVATIIREMSFVTENERTHIAEQFADRLRYTNSNFNRSRFLRACDPSNGRNR